MKNVLLAILAITLIFTLAIPVIVINTIRKLYRLESLREYFKVVAFGFDQAGGAIIYAQEDWMVSSWTYYLWRNSNGKNRWAYGFMVFINTIFMDKDHCKDSFYDEAERLKFRTEWM